MKRRWMFILLGIMLLVVPAFMGCASPEEQVDEPETEPGVETETEEEGEPITLEWVGFRPETHQGVVTIDEKFFAPIEEMSNGELTIEWMGGPDTMDPSDVGRAVQRGTIDVASIYVGAYEAVVPGVGGLMLSELSAIEEREGEAFEFISALHEEEGIKYLGRPDAQEESFFYTWLRGDKLETKEDFQNAEIGSAAGARAAVLGWEATHTTVAVPENYTAMERGIADGIAGQPMQGAVSGGWHELTNYVIDHPYYQSTVVMLMNLDSWNQLPEHLQDIVMEAIKEGEKEVMNHRAELNLELREQIEDVGAEFYELSPDVAEWYVDTAYSAGWEYQMERFPEVTPELKELLSE